MAEALGVSRRIFTALARKHRMCGLWHRRRAVGEDFGLVPCWPRGGISTQLNVSEVECMGELVE
jgi:hypothetical protein